MSVFVRRLVLMNNHDEPPALGIVQQTDCLFTSDVAATRL